MTEGERFGMEMKHGGWRARTSPWRRGYIAATRPGPVDLGESSASGSVASDPLTSAAMVDRGT